MESIDQNISLTPISEMTDVDAKTDSDLHKFVDRIERLEAEKQNFTDDIKTVYDEAKASGYHVKILKKVIALRKQNPEDRQEELALLRLYLSQLGMGE